jgi:cardiolipin synthase A/B
LPDLSHNESLFAAILFLVVYALAAGAVTADALLRKQSVRAAISWIGLAWLSPIFGAIVYYVLGVNRVTRRALQFRRAVAPREGQSRRDASPALPENIATLSRVVETLTGRELVDGNRITILHGGDEAYPAMLAAIRQARRSVALASYIFRADDAGLALIDALAEAWSRGVQVRVLIDGIGGGYLAAPVVRALRQRGLSAASFLHYWMPWRMPYLNMRSHKKILVVDGAVGFTGGINIADSYVLSRRPPRPVDDIHFRVDGPVVAHLMVAFAEDWNFTTGEVLDDDAWWPALDPVGPVWARGFSSGPDATVRRLEAVFATAVAAAKQRLRIVTPYFLPDEHLVSAIDLAVLRGVAVDIVVPMRSDHVLIDWAARAQLGFMAPAIRIHLAPPPFSHAKLMTVDGEWCLLGTANWDVRSTRLNFEFSLECYDTATTAAVDRLIDARIATARRVSSAELARRPSPLRLRDAAARLLLPYL